MYRHRVNAVLALTPFRSVIFLPTGFGSVGTIVEGPVVGFIAEHYGWKSTFYLMIGLSLMSVLTMIRAARLNDRLRQNVF